jgi:quinol monooxygenase YgiN
VLSLEKVDDVRPAGWEDRRQRTGVQTARLHGEGRQYVQVPVDPEVIGRDPGGEGGDRQGGLRALLETSVDANAARLEVRQDHRSEGIPAQTGLERDVVAQPGQTERDVRRAATRMCGERPASALADEVDERFSDDDEHRITLLLSVMSDRDRPLFLVVTIKPRLDRLAEAEAQLQSMRRSTLTEPGCVFMHLVQPQDDPDTWVMLEMFRSRAAWDEHMRQTYNTEGNKILEDLLREPSELRLFDEK